MSYEQCDCEACVRVRGGYENMSKSDLLDYIMASRSAMIKVLGQVQKGSVNPMLIMVIENEILVLDELETKSQGGAPAGVQKVTPDGRTIH